MRERYTDEQKQFLLQHGADLSTSDLTMALNKKFGSSHSKQSVRTFAKRIGVRKSKKHYAALGVKNGKPIGSIKIIGGYEYIKVAYSQGGFYKDWRRKIDIEYEKAYGNIPKGYMVITLDNNRLNSSADNLCVIPKAIAARMANGRGKSLWSEFPEVTRTAIKICELNETIKHL